jgi:hypothetical protein
MGASGPRLQPVAGARGGIFKPVVGGIDPLAQKPDRQPAGNPLMIHRLCVLGSAKRRTESGRRHVEPLALRCDQIARPGQTG